MFLPINYPHSVHPSYLRFHVFQTLETFCGAVISVLCSQAMLESLGIAEEASVAGAVAVQWVLKDGIAEIAKLFFIERYAQSFDSHPKIWKVIAEIMTTAGSGLQIATLVAPGDHFLLYAAGGNILKSIAWALWGTTHTCFIKQFTITNNLGDLVAKAESQGAAAQIAGWLCGLFIISHDHSSFWLFSCYFILGPVHVFSTLGLIKSADFQTLNESKMMLVIDHYLTTSNIPDPEDLTDKEGWFGETISSKIKMPFIKLGVTADVCFANVDEAKQSLKVCEF
jgi:hypothetical protein